jgi:hypothetical protein
MAILNFTPNRSIIAGGRKVRITGNNTFLNKNVYYLLKHTIINTQDLLDW